jgi:Cu/Ag efflux protein CusF
MSHQRRIVSMGVVLACVLALTLGAGPVLAQTSAPQSAPSQSIPDRPSVSSVEGTVKKVDAPGGKVQISSGLFGMFGRTLEVRPITQIQVEGRQSSLADIREGDRVKAAYEVREGQSIAKSIDVLPELRKAPSAQPNPSSRSAPPRSQ